MSNLRNLHVPCYYFDYVHVDFRMRPWRMAILRNVMLFIIYLLSIGPMPHVDFKKWPCRRVKFRGQGPLI